MINTQGLRLVADLLKENRPVLAGIHVFEDDNMKHTGCPKKMFISKKGARLTNEHFFWDTWYIVTRIQGLHKKLKS